MPKFIWQAEFSVEPTLKESETIGDYVFELKENGETVVKRTYETSTFDELHSKRRHACEYADETLSRLDAEAIRTILLRRMIYQRLVSPINIKLVAHPTLRNEDELKATGSKLRRRVARSFAIKYAILDVGDSLAESNHFWNSGFQGNAKGQENKIVRIAEWLEQSEHEIDDVKGFILCWIGFNGLYGLVASLNGKSDKNDADKFEFVIEQLISPSQAEEIIRNIGKEITKFETYSIFSGKGNTPWSSKLSAERGKPVMNKVKILKLVTRCIYGVRKQVFHEAPSTVDVLERATYSKAALMRITLMCLKSFVTH